MRPVRAFTLLETIATIAIMAMIMATSAGLISAAADAYADSAQRSRLNTGLTTALDRVARELKYIPQGTTNGTSAITSLTATSIAWNPSSSITLSSGRLMITTPETTNAVLFDGVTAFSLTAYNESNVAMGASLSGVACEPIRRIGVSISATAEGVTQTLRTKVFIRSCVSGSGH